MRWVAHAVDRQNLKEGEDGADDRLGEDVGTGQEDRRLGSEIEHGEGLHQGLLMAGGDDVGSVGGEVLQTVDIEDLVMATGAELHKRTQYIIEDIVVLNFFGHNSKLFYFQRIILYLTIVCFCKYTKKNKFKLLRENEKIR